jgi:hypothetical protein
VKHPIPIPSRTVRQWLVAIAADTHAFSLADGSAKTCGKNTQPWDEAFTVVPTGSRKHLRLLVDVKARLQPQHAFAVVEQLRNTRDHAGPNTVPVVAAPYVSERVAEVCREHRLGYFDGAGNCHLSGPGFFVHVEGRPNLAPDTRAADDLFAPKSSRVVRAILEHPRRWWQVQGLADEMGVSLGLASRVKRKLVEQAFAEATPRGVRAREPADLLDVWATSYTNRARAASVYSLDDLATLEGRIVRWGAERLVKCALAEFSAASRMAPMVRFKRAAVYVAESGTRDVLAELLKDLDLKEVDSGASAILWLTEDDSVFYNAENRDGLSTVSPLQTYLDLRRNPARGEEAATELLRRTILPRFTTGSTS